MPSKDGKDGKPVRIATCGACGCERAVDTFMRRTRDCQFTARPSKDTDLFYCGCQDDDD